MSKLPLTFDKLCLDLSEHLTCYRRINWTEKYQTINFTYGVNAESETNRNDDSRYYKKQLINPLPPLPEKTETKIRVKMLFNQSIQKRTNHSWWNSSTANITRVIALNTLLILTNINELSGLKCVCNPDDCDLIRQSDCPGRGTTVWDPCK